MKVIISHDVDHLTVFEHARDFIIPKFLVRSAVGLAKGGISFREYWNLWLELFHNKWNYLEQLMSFDRARAIPATYFVAVQKGLGLSYGVPLARLWIQEIQKRGFEVGIHGICFDNMRGIQREHEAFRKVSGSRQFGTRMHYLRLAPQTLTWLDQVGCTFDSSVYALANPSKLGQIVEFPLSIMDVNILYGRSQWAAVALREAQDMTLRIVDQALKRDLKYLTILFHDRYFGAGFARWRDWYIWLIEYLKQNRITFVSYSQALTEVNRGLLSYVAIQS